MLSRLNTRPARSPVNASTPPLRAAPHDSGPVWVASSLPYDSFIHYTSPVLPAHKEDSYGVYFIFKSMEQGRTFRIGVPKYPTADPNYRILAHRQSRFHHKPEQQSRPNSQLEAACHKADKAIENIVDLLQAA